MSFGIIASSSKEISGGVGDNTAFANAVLAQSPIAYWRLDELSGTVANDQTANNHDGDYVGTPTFDAIGMIEGYASRSTYFNNPVGGTLNAYVDAPVASWMDTAQITVACVVMSPEDNGLAMIASRYYDPDQDRSWFLFRSNQSFRFYVRDRYNPASELIVDSGYTYQFGHPYFVAAYASATETGIRVYDETGLVAAVTGAGHDVFHSSRNLRLMCDDSLSYPNESYLSDFVYYDHVVAPSALDSMAALALEKHPKWITSSIGVSGRNGTSNHTITFPATTAGSLQVAVIYTESPGTLITPGWTKRLSSVASGDGALEVYTRNVNAGETTLQMNYPTANYPLNYAIYELPSGSAFYSETHTINDLEYNLTLSGLPGTPVLVLEAAAFSITSTGIPPISAVSRYGWTKSVDSEIPSDGITYGNYMTIVYREYVASVAATPNFQIINAAGLSYQQAVIAFYVP